MSTCMKEYMLPFYVLALVIVAYVHKFQRQLLELMLFSLINSKDCLATSPWCWVLFYFHFPYLRLMCVLLFF